MIVTLPRKLLKKMESSIKRVIKAWLNSIHGLYPEEIEHSQFFVFVITPTSIFLE